MGLFCRAVVVAAVKMAVEVAAMVRQLLQGFRRLFHRTLDLDQMDVAATAGLAVTASVLVAKPAEQRNFAVVLIAHRRQEHDASPVAVASGPCADPACAAVVAAVAVAGPVAELDPASLYPTF